MKKGVKIILAVVGILLVAVVLYSVLSSDSSGEPAAGQSGLVSGTTNQAIQVTQPQTQTSGVQVGQEFVTLLLNLQGVDLDTALFTNPAFLSLQDKSIRFKDPGGQGRPNPFAPIGSDAISNEAPAPEPDPAPAPEPGPTPPSNDPGPDEGLDLDA